MHCVCRYDHVTSYRWLAAEDVAAYQLCVSFDNVVYSVVFLLWSWLSLVADGWTIPQVETKVIRCFILDYTHHNINSKSKRYTCSASLVREGSHLLDRWKWLCYILVLWRVTGIWSLENGNHVIKN